MSTAQATTDSLAPASALATARKSLGEYKPLIRYPSGKTEVCEQSPDRRDIGDVRAGGKRGNRLARGTTYRTREEAVKAAQSVIDQRRQDAERRLERFLALGRRTDYVRNEIQLWGG